MEILYSSSWKNTKRKSGREEHLRLETKEMTKFGLALAIDRSYEKSVAIDAF